MVLTVEQAEHIIVAEPQDQRRLLAGLSEEDSMRLFRYCVYMAPRAEDILTSTMPEGEHIEQVKAAVRKLKEGNFPLS